MRYFIRTPGISADRVLGPFDPIEVLQKAKLLRDSGLDYFITEEYRSIVVNEEAIKRRAE
jgi:hypothetical protein